jgi:hypothetical protein
MLAIACLAASTPVATAAAPAGHARMAIDGAALLTDPLATAERNDVVVLQPWQHDRLAALKAARPGVKVLMYKNLSSAKESNAGGIYATGIGLQWIEANHPEWLLLNPEGERIHFRGYPNLVATDVGDPGYQAQWADNVVAELLAAPWDGVFIDDANPTMRHHYDVGRVAKYPTDEAYSAATESALAHIGPRVRAAGRISVANIGSWVDYGPAASRFLDHVDGGLDESFGKWGNDPRTGYVDTTQWERQLGAVVEAERRDKLFVGVAHSQNDDAAAARYGWATMLLGARSRSSYAFGADYTNETWFPFYDYDLGEPAGEVEPRADGVRQRRFANGVALVNPTATSRTVALDVPHSGSGYKRTRSVKLAARSALVLVRDTARTTQARVGAGEAADALGATGRRDVTLLRVRHDGGSRKVVVTVSCPLGSVSETCKSRVRLFAARGRAGKGPRSEKQVGQQVVRVPRGKSRSVSIRLSRRSARRTRGHVVRAQAAV